MKHDSITIRERTELIIREYMNKAEDIELFTAQLAEKVVEIIQDEIKYGRKA